MDKNSWKRFEGDRVKKNDLEQREDFVHQIVSYSSNQPTDWNGVGSQCQELGMKVCNNKYPLKWSVRVDVQSK